MLSCYNAIFERVHSAAKLAGRSTPVRLVAVSKLQPAAAVHAAFASGADHFGENYVQELLEKCNQCPADIRWHFIGQLQSNKARALVEGVPNLWAVESVDSVKLAVLLERAAAATGRGFASSVGGAAAAAAAEVASAARSHSLVDSIGGGGGGSGSGSGSGGRGGGGSGGGGGSSDGASSGGEKGSGDYDGASSVSGAVLGGGGGNSLGGAGMGGGAFDDGASSVGGGWLGRVGGGGARAPDPLRVYVQVNTSGEEHKGGVEPGHAAPLAAFVLQHCPHLQLQGLMTIGQLGVSSDVFFRVLADERAAVRAAIAEGLRVSAKGDVEPGRGPPVPPPALELSMGMSNDFESAIEFGADSVRVGSAIFGERPAKGRA
jgi:uncharacterized pyridoxal phosphate-containing UPF0001 family protein